MIETGRSNAALVQALQAIAAQTRVPIEMLVGELFPNASQLLAATATPPPPPPKPGSLEAVGDKGAGQIIDLLEKVSTGMMGREAAIQTLVTVNGLSRERAEGIVPDQALPKPEPGAK